MIESILLRDFQCHHKLRIDLDPLVTSVTGDSDAGKSAVLRALGWTCFNRPSGSAFVRVGAGYSRVDLVVDGRKVVRRSGDGKNEYRLDDGRFSSFGTGVPPPVADLLNLDPTLNFQWQTDPPFWFGLTPGEVSRELNAVVNLGLIDRTVANLASEHRKARSVVEVTEARLAEARKAQKDLAWVGEANEDLVGVDSVQNDRDGRRMRCDDLSQLLDAAVVAEGLVHADMPGVRPLEDVFSLWRESGEQLHRLGDLIEEAEEAHAWLTRCENESGRTREALAALTKDRCPLCQRVLTS